MAEPPTKVCPQCAETIKAAARVCPRCRTPLTFKGLFFPFVFPMVILIAIYSPFLLLLWWQRDVNGHEREFDPGHDKITVYDTRQHYSQSGQTNYITTVGFLRNESAHAWKSIQLEVRYFNEQGKLTDTKTETLSFQTLPAGMTGAFRLRAEAAAEAAAYVSNQVFVVTAQNAQNRFSPD